MFEYSSEKEFSVKSKRSHMPEDMKSAIRVRSPRDSAHRNLAAITQQTRIVGW